MVVLGIHLLKEFIANYYDDDHNDNDNDNGDNDTNQSRTRFSSTTYK